MSLIELIIDMYLTDCLFSFVLYQAILVFNGNPHLGQLFHDNYGIKDLLSVKGTRRHTIRSW